MVKAKATAASKSEILCPEPMIDMPSGVFRSRKGLGHVKELLNGTGRDHKNTKAKKDNKYITRTVLKIEKR